MIRYTACQEQQAWNYMAARAAVASVALVLALVLLKNFLMDFPNGGALCKIKTALKQEIPGLAIF